MRIQSEEVWAPLAGMKVLDLSAQLPGPLAAAILGDMGADVIKIEPPGGDFARTMTQAMFQGVNRNKRSLALDLKLDASRSIVARLAAWADVVIESYRPGVATRLGVDAEQLRTHNTQLVYCSLSGYGQTGPWRSLPGHDLGYLAAAGAMGLPGQWGSPPHRSGLPIADLMAGSIAANAILAAIQQRDSTGNGCYLDLSLYEAALYCTGLRFGFEVKEPSQDHLFPTNDLFEAADGRTVALTIIEDHFWSKFQAVARRWDPVLAEERFSTAAGRRQHGDELNARLKSLFRSQTAAEWAELLLAHDVPAKVCLFPAEAARGPQAVARNALTERDGTLFCPFPVKVDGNGRPSVRTGAPRLGADSQAVLQELGFTNAEINLFVSSGVVFLPQS